MTKCLICCFQTIRSVRDGRTRVLLHNRRHTDGNLELVNIVMDAMNKEVDPNADEKRGGSGMVGKMLLSAGTDQLALVARIPKDKTSKAMQTSQN